MEECIHSRVQHRMSFQKWPCCRAHGASRTEPSSILLVCHPKTVMLLACTQSHPVCGLRAAQSLKYRFCSTSSHLRSRSQRRRSNRPHVGLRGLRHRNWRSISLPRRRIVLISATSVHPLCLTMGHPFEMPRTGHGAVRKFGHILIGLHNPY